MDVTNSKSDPIRADGPPGFPVPLSILELANVSTGSTSGAALTATTEIAEGAQRWGFHRLWVAEHHNMPSVASSSPAVLLAHLAAHTTTLRLGSGGVMLPNHAPLVVAEQFATLEALHPGRIDLGIGRAPGTDGLTAAAIRGAARAGEDDFPQHVAEVRAFLEDQFPAEHAYSRIGLMPRPLAGPPVWLLGSSGYSAQLAGLMGLPYAYARHFSRRNTLPALELYRSSFRPSESLEAPYAMVCTGAVAADSDEEAERLATSGALAMLLMRSGQPGPIPTPEDAVEFEWSGHAAEHLRRWLGNVAHGRPERVLDELEEIQRETDADELMLTASIHGEAARIRSFELLGEALHVRAEAVPSTQA